MGEVKIEGAIDLHCHYGPDFVQKGGNHNHSVTALQAAQEARAAGMAAIVLKSHDFPTAALAYTINQVEPGVKTFGAITLDHQVGGPNALAVEHALRLGAKIVWLPTVASRQDHLNGIGAMLGYKGEGYTVIDEDGALTPTAREILALAAEHDACVATGHTSAAEHFAIAREFGRRGKVIVTHAGEKAAGPHLNAAQCVQLAELGAFIELTAATCMGHMNYEPMGCAEVARLISQVRPERCTLATDYGYSQDTPKPAPGFKDYVDGLWKAGVSEAQLRLMASENPARLLGL